jgi:hypothetical protein
MSDALIVLHTAIAIIVIVLLILVVRVDPMISVVIGTIYLGLAAGLGFEDTIGTIAQGFGDIMVEVGFGVLLGSLLLAMGALQKLVRVLLRLLGPQKLPYAFSAALSTIFPAIYVDVQLVLAAPLARSPDEAGWACDDERDADRRHTSRIRLRRPRSGNQHLRWNKQGYRASNLLQAPLGLHPLPPRLVSS